MYNCIGTTGATIHLWYTKHSFESDGYRKSGQKRQAYVLTRIEARLRAHLREAAQHVHQVNAAELGLHTGPSSPTASSDGSTQFRALFEHIARSAGDRGKSVALGRGSSQRSKDGDLVLSRRGFVEAVEHDAMLQLPKAELTLLLDRIDANRDNQISFQEFLRFVQLDDVEMYVGQGTVHVLFVLSSIRVQHVWCRNMVSRSTQAMLDVLDGAVRSYVRTGMTQSGPFVAKSLPGWTKVAQWRVSLIQH